LKAGAFTLSGGLLVGCEHVPFVENLRSLSDPRLRSSKIYPLSAAQIKALPYASLGVQLEGSQKAVLILATVKDGTSTWVSSNEEQLSFRGPTIVSTKGLPRDLVDSRWLRTDATPILPGAGQVTRCARSLDIGRGKKAEHNIKANSVFHDEGLETLTILDESRATRRIVEYVDFPEWRWKQKNLYWIDSVNTAQLWKSVSRYSPDTPEITVETLKSYQMV
jgi:hypothetical protein